MKELSLELTEKIINFIIASPLNVDVIPDDIERQLYEVIFETICAAINSGACTTACSTIKDKILACVKSCKSHSVNK